MKVRTRFVWAVLALVLGLPQSLAQRASSISLEEFRRVALEFSEPSGRFETDNLISNESSYLHVMPHLEQLSHRPGKAYVGVGPDQNFSYIAHLRPEIAVIVDIRRDNLLHHVFFKQLFLASANRWEYLSALFGRPLPPDFQVSDTSDAAELARQFREFPLSDEYFEQVFERTWNNIHQRYPRLVLEQDRYVVRKIALAFFQDNLQLRYRSHGRLPRPYYPTYQQLMTETDLDGNRGHFLNSEKDFQYIKGMQEEHRILLVTGDFAGPKALEAVGTYLRERGYTVSAFYLSNVEFYLFRGDAYLRFIENLEALPSDENTLLIRSYFSYWQSHPETVPGYFVTSLVQNLSRFLELHRERPYNDYWDMVTRDYLPNVTRSFP